MSDVDGVDVTCPTLSEYGVMQAVDNEALAVISADSSHVTNSTIIVDGMLPIDFSSNVKASLKYAIAKVSRVNTEDVLFTHLVELRADLFNETAGYRGFAIGFDMPQQSALEAGLVADLLADSRQVDPAAIGVPTASTDMSPSMAV